MTREQVIQMLDEHLAQLGEHFDAIQILASDCEGGSSRIFLRGAGNFYTRKGMAHQFLENDAASDSAFYIANALRE